MDEIGGKLWYRVESSFCLECLSSEMTRREPAGGVEIDKIRSRSCT